MKTADFYYDLPEELIAQDPLTDRASSKLMVLNKETGEKTHTDFHHIIDYLHEGDCLVINDTKVIPARLIGEREETCAATAGASTLLPIAETARTGACGVAFPGLTRSRGQQPLDGQCDLAVRCNVDDLHLYCIAIVQHRVDILHKFVGHLGNVDHADTPLRQRNKCAKGLYRRCQYGPI